MFLWRPLSCGGPGQLPSLPSLKSGPDAIRTIWYCRFHNYCLVIDLRCRHAHRISEKKTFHNYCVVMDLRCRHTHCVSEKRLYQTHGRLGSNSVEPQHARFFAPTRFHNPNEILIGSSLFVRFTAVFRRQTHRQTDHATSLARGRLFTVSMRCGLVITAQ